jgi:hypothetical protein
MKIRREVMVLLDEDEQFGMTISGRHFMAKTLRWESGDEDVVIYLHRVFSNGRVTSNSSMIIKRGVHSLPDIVRPVFIDAIPFETGLTQIINKYRPESDMPDMAAAKKNLGNSIDTGPWTT